MFGEKRRANGISRYLLIYLDVHAWGKTMIWSKWGVAEAHPAVGLTCAFPALRLRFLPKKGPLRGEQSVWLSKRRQAGFQNSLLLFIKFIFFGTIFRMIVCFHMSTPTHTCKQLRCPKIVSFREEIMAQFHLNLGKILSCW